jgi:hypothetical protein
METSANLRYLLNSDGVSTNGIRTKLSEEEIVGVLLPNNELCNGLVYGKGCDLQF